MGKCTLPKSYPLKGLFNLPHHKHAAVDIVEDSEHMFISQALLEAITNGSAPEGVPSGKVSPSDIAWNKNYRTLTDVEKLDFASKAPGKHNQPAATITESETKMFVTADQKAAWDDAADKISAFNLWQRAVIEANTVNYVAVGNRQSHQFFILRYIAKTVVATEINTIFIDYTVGTGLVKIVANIYNGAFVGIDNIGVRLNPDDENLIEMVLTVGNSDIILFMFNVEKIKL